jgi:hypothetical protein
MFRAWDKELNKYWTDVLSEMGEVDNYDDELSMWSVGRKMETGDSERFDFEQYTGLKDKNGKEVYFKSDKVKGVDSHGVEYVGIISNDDPYCTGLVMDNGDFIPLHVFAYSEPFEIIGNIHEKEEIPY